MAISGIMKKRYEIYGIASRAVIGATIGIIFGLISMCIVVGISGYLDKPLDMIYMLLAIILSGAVGAFFAILPYPKE